MSKKRVRRHPEAFRRMAVERMKQCGHIGNLARELGVNRCQLYYWRRQAESSGPRRPSTPLRLPPRHTRAARTRHGGPSLRSQHPVCLLGLSPASRQASHPGQHGRPANPYDNAQCESFMRTLKREEIHANSYRDLDDLRVRIGVWRSAEGRYPTSLDEPNPPLAAIHPRQTTADGYS